MRLRQNKIEENTDKLNQSEKIIEKNEKNYRTILVGLNNKEANCYMNPTLQCLSNSKKLTEYFLNKYKKDSYKIMANEYYEVVKNLWDTDRKNKAYSPSSFNAV